jgi:hypothetical protein
VGLIKPALEGYASQIRLCAPAIVSATLMKRVWVDRANHCMLQTLPPAGIGAMWTLNALFMKNARIITVSDASQENASIAVR